MSVAYAAPATPSAGAPSRPNISAQVSGTLSAAVSAPIVKGKRASRVAASVAFMSVSTNARAPPRSNGRR